jgi:hypothetical protein
MRANVDVAILHGAAEDAEIVARHIVGARR